MNLTDKEIIALRNEKADKVEANWKQFKGKTQYVRSLRGEYLNKRDSDLAQCYYCCSGYEDGALNCGCYDCACYNNMPYKKEEGVEE